MKIFITGITGLFGSYLAREFSGVGQLHGLRRPSSDTSLLGKLATSIQWHEGDITDFQSLESALSDMDLVIHAAALLPVYSREQEQFLKVNTEGTQNVVNVMLQNGSARLVYISAASALGADPETSLVNEQYKWTASHLNSPYAVSKHLGELEVWRGAQEGLEVMVFNPTALLPRQEDDRSSAGIYSHIQEYFSKARGNFHYIDIRDAAALVAQLINKNKWGSRYILSKESLPLRDFSTAVKRTFGAGLRFQPSTFLDRVSSFFRRWRFGKFEGLSALTDKKPVVYDNSLIKSTLAYSYRTLEETLFWAAGNERKSESVK